MSAKNLFLAIVEAGLWYVFLYGFIYTIKNPVYLPYNTLGLLIIGYLAAWACPLIRNSDGWRRTFGK